MRTTRRESTAKPIGRTKLQGTGLRAHEAGRGREASPSGTRPQVGGWRRKHKESMLMRGICSKQCCSETCPRGVATSMPEAWFASCMLQQHFRGMLVDHTIYLNVPVRITLCHAFPWQAPRTTRRNFEADFLTTCLKILRPLVNGTNLLTRHAHRSCYRRYTTHNLVRGSHRSHVR
jgi:hypothetical protein